MSATSLQVLTVAFPNPEWSNTNTFERINSTISFYHLTTFTLRTLSSAGAQPGASITGLLYVPTLPANDPCIEAAAPYVPQNVTRQKELPDVDYDLIAVAPWLSPECVRRYLDSAQRGPVRALLFYLPNNSTGAPPEADDIAWSLGDGDDWKKQYGYPIYAIPGQSGNLLMQASSQYSGNMTEVPQGHLISESYDSRDYVRLFAELDTTGGTTLPSLWVFLLVVLGILLAVIGFTSLVMHYLQRRRRQALRRRVANGEVDLEALGIKRLTVPQEVLDKMPLYTYGSGAPVVPSSVARETNPSTMTRDPNLAADKLTSPTRPSPPPRNPSTSSYHPTPLQQPTCAICLDDFVPGSDGNKGTIVRELPCHHIFHPECVDTFLRDSSSLCPMCKKSALPKGYCPRVVTNAMVRRERMMRRIRPTTDAEAEEEGAAAAPSVPMSGGAATRMRPWTQFPDGFPRRTNGRRVVSSPPAPSADNNSQPMTEIPHPPSATVPRRGLSRLHSRSATTGGTTIQPSSNATRREWARQRAIAMLGRRAPLDPELEEAQRTPGWRKALRSVFPAAGGSRDR
ncbi:hypothetical protein LTR37_011340 [Vermiconidia calcicola]|uniref:Uncharacterized protein n=1 Tax=Vermiconidia calcicola TaxID=1690605 RepID=A0ACC3N2N0_9PEZI|nr:hypothetical protein LTR37_011340 [Vermiconidia calcicola]